MKRRLDDILSSLSPAEAGILEIHWGDTANPEIQALHYDSRLLEGGDMYFALPGLHADGHSFIDEAVNERGAAVIVHEKDLPSYSGRASYIRVKSSRFAMSPLAAAFYGYPSKNLMTIGVTGTEGKSTTVYLIYQLLNMTGTKAGFISTVMLDKGLGEYINKEHQTTPEALTIQKLLWEMKENGALAAVVEASSHGLSKKLNRLGDALFDAAVMTNVTHEHLEFHGTWEHYRSDKAELFRALDRDVHRKIFSSGPKDIPSFGCVNADDKSAAYFADATMHKCYTFSTKGAEADLSLELIESGPAGNWYDVRSSEREGETLTIRDALPGAFNAGNVLAALITVSKICSLGIRELIPLVPRLKPVRGRMTAVNCGQDFEVLVDYAHTPSSFETIFPPLRERLSTAGKKIISLFGSAGERDTKKRSEQGRIAARYSDIVILSDEDPRREDPMAILREIAAGCTADELAENRKTIDKNLFLIPSRPAAIRKAFSLARPGDLVLLLGKGHENSIIYGDKATPYDEIGEAEKALKDTPLLTPNS